MLINTRPRTSRENRAAIVEAVKRHGIGHVCKIGDSCVLAILKDGSSEMVVLSTHLSEEMMDYRIKQLAGKFKGEKP